MQVQNQITFAQRLSTNHTQLMPDFYWSLAHLCWLRVPFLGDPSARYWCLTAVAPGSGAFGRL